MTYWSKNAEKKFYKTTFFQAIANFSEEANVTDDGRIIDRPYRSSVIAENYTKGTALTAQDLTYTEDLLTIDQQYSLLMYVDRAILSTLNFLNCWKLPLNILAKTEYLKRYIRTMLENNMVGTISSQA